MGTVAEIFACFSRISVFKHLPCIFHEFFTFETPVSLVLQVVVSEGAVCQSEMLAKASGRSTVLRQHDLMPEIETIVVSIGLVVL